MVGGPVLLNRVVVMTARKCLVHCSWVESKLDSWLLVSDQDIMSKLDSRDGYSSENGNDYSEMWSCCVMVVMIMVAVVAITVVVTSELYKTADGCTRPQLLDLFSETGF